MVARQRGVQPFPPPLLAFLDIHPPKSFPFSQDDSSDSGPIPPHHVSHVALVLFPSVILPECQTTIASSIVSSFLTHRPFFMSLLSPVLVPLLFPSFSLFLKILLLSHFWWVPPLFTQVPPLSCQPGPGQRNHLGPVPGESCLPWGVVD